MNIARSFIFLFAFLIAGSAFGQDLNAIKSDMQKRQPKIEALWKQGLIGENNEGYLSPRGSLSADQEKLVKAENDDRKQVYSAIAQKSKSTPKEVGVQRARQISQRAATGLWLQNEKGDWFKK